MSNNAIHTFLRQAKSTGAKKLAVLIDPDKGSRSMLDGQLDVINKAGVELIFFGGSLLTKFELDEQLRLMAGLCLRHGLAKGVMF